MSRVAISLDPHALTQLRKRAEANHEPVARTAACLVRDGLLSAHGARTFCAAEAPDQQYVEQDNHPPAWLEPSSSPRQWRQRLWAAVVGLHERYPRALAHLPAEWWADRALAEKVGALAEWRAQLDAGKLMDPRAELLFHDRLATIERELMRDADPTGARFARGSPPPDWASLPDQL